MFRFGIRRRIALLELVGMTFLCAGLANAANSVVIESKTIPSGATGVQVGVYLTNDVSIRQVLIPFEVRSWTGGGYIANTFGLAINGSGRIAGSVLDYRIINERPNPDGTCLSGPSSHSFSSIASDVNYVSPDAVLFTAFRSTGTSLPPGSDPAGNPSLRFTFDVSSGPGTFVIDTCCINPANHIVFIDDASIVRLPGLTVGVITIDSPLPDYAADVNCDGNVDVVDVVAAINQAFRGQTLTVECH